MDEDALTELLETAESAEGFADVVAVMVHACSGSCEDGQTVGEAAGDGEKDAACMSTTPYHSVYCILSVMFRMASSAESRVTFGENGACEAVLSLLQTFMEEPSIVEVALGVIRKLATECPENQARFAKPETSCASLVVQSMREHSDGEATLQEQACLAAEALALNSEANASQLSAVGIREMLVAAEKQITNERNKTYPARALAAIFP